MVVAKVFEKQGPKFGRSRAHNSAQPVIIRIYDIWFHLLSAIIIFDHTYLSDSFSPFGEGILHRLRS